MTAVEEHKSFAPKSVACFVLTVSDTRTDTNDTGGQSIRELLRAAGHTITGHAIVRDDPEAVVHAVQRQLDGNVQIIITTGGTGITSRDSTYEVVSQLIEKSIEGFGELFRMLSFQEIGSAAMMTRACAGVAAGKVIISLPGSENAVRLAMTTLILPELGHLVREISR